MTSANQFDKAGAESSTGPLCATKENAWSILNYVHEFYIKKKPFGVNAQFFMFSIAKKISRNLNPFKFI